MDKITYEQANEVAKKFLKYLEDETDYCMWHRMIKVESEMILSTIIFTELK